MPSKRDPNKLERDRRKRAMRDPHFLAKKLEGWRRYASKPDNQEKIRARNKVKHLCRVGKMQRGDCEACGKPNAEAHHEDYSQPLNVRWFCRKCHSLEHKRLAG
jgi:ribosomal protein S27AE